MRSADEVKRAVKLLEMATIESRSDNDIAGYAAMGGTLLWMLGDEDDVIDFVEKKYGPKLDAGIKRSDLDASPMIASEVLLQLLRADEDPEYKKRLLEGKGAWSEFGIDDD